MLKKWAAQIETDCSKDKIPVILNKANGKELIAILPFKVFHKFSGSKTINSEVVTGDSVEAISKLKHRYEVHRVLVELGEKIEDNCIQVIYYSYYDEVQMNNYILVFMLASEWLRLIGKLVTSYNSQLIPAA